MDRRSFFGTLMKTGVVVATVVEVSGDMKMSQPDKIVACWSGWRTAPDNNRLCAWYTAHLPRRMEHPKDQYHGYPAKLGYSHFVSLVNSARIDPSWAVPVGGYNPGDCFNTCNSIILEESDEALRAWQTPQFEQVLNEVFVANKKLALDRLVAYLQELVPLKES